MWFELGNGYFDVHGYATKESNLKIVGDKGSKLCEFSLIIGKKQDGSNITTYCKAWRKIAITASRIQKGDSVRCLGTIEEREYNGKTYRNLICEWISVCGGNSTSASSPIQSQSEQSREPGDDSVEFDESDSPFG